MVFESTIFDDASSSCIIDALITLCKKSSFFQEELSDIDSDEVDNMYSLLLNGEASRYDIEEVEDLNILWSCIRRILSTVKFFISIKNTDLEDYCDSFPNYVQRFFVSSLKLLFDGIERNIDEDVLNLLKHYKEWFAFSYMFMRRASKSPPSSVETVSEYILGKSNNSKTSLNNSLASPSNDDSEPGVPPSIAVPNIQPLQPYPSATTELSNSPTDLPGVQGYSTLNSPEGGPGQVYGTENSILDSYYSYGWQGNDEDEDSEHEYVPKAVVKTKRMTRMRSPKKAERRSVEMKNRNKQHKTKPKNKSALSWTDDEDDDSGDKKAFTGEKQKPTDVLQLSLDSETDILDIEDLNSENKSSNEEDNKKNQKSGENPNRLSITDEVTEFFVDEYHSDEETFPSKYPQKINFSKNNKNANSASSFDLSDTDQLSQKPKKSDSFTLKSTSVDFKDLRAKGINPLDASVELGKDYAEKLDNKIEKMTKEPKKINIKSSADSWEKGSVDKNIVRLPTASPSRNSEKSNSPNKTAWEEPEKDSNSPPKPKLRTERPPEGVKESDRGKIGSDMPVRGKRTDGLEKQFHKSDQISPPLLSRSMEKERIKPYLSSGSIDLSKSFDHMKGNKSLSALPNHSKPRYDENRNSYESNYQSQSLEELKEDIRRRRLQPKSTTNNNSLTLSSDQTNDENQRNPTRLPPTRRSVTFGDTTPLVSSANTGIADVTDPSSSAHLNFKKGEEDSKKAVNTELNKSLEIETSLINPHKLYVEEEGFIEGKRSELDLPISSTPRILKSSSVGESRSGLPPRVNSGNSEYFLGKSQNILQNQSNQPFQQFPENFQPPPLSEYAKATGVVVEGWLSKKSKRLGIWVKRYFVLSESSTCFCVLRVYGKAVQSKWGMLPSQLRSSIPLAAVELVQTVGTVSKKGKEFMIKFYPRVHQEHQLPSDPLTDGGVRDSIASQDVEGVNNRSETGSQVGSENGSIYSDASFGSDTKLMTLQAVDAETRLLWVTMLNMALHAALNEL